MVFYQTEVPGMQKKKQVLRLQKYKQNDCSKAFFKFFLLCTVNHMAGMLNFRTLSYNY
uniref:Uncharacterized protein n=1 Tax=Anguilla anguilla TaxID=7936 RepID=A0A0E9QQB5_ANGAN